MIIDGYEYTWLPFRLRPYEADWHLSPEYPVGMGGKARRLHRLWRRMLIVGEKKPSPDFHLTTTTRGLMLAVLGIGIMLLGIEGHAWWAVGFTVVFGSHLRAFVRTLMGEE